MFLCCMSALLGFCMAKALIYSETFVTFCCSKLFNYVFKGNTIARTYHSRRSAVPRHLTACQIWCCAVFLKWDQDQDLQFPSPESPGKLVPPPGGPGRGHYNFPVVDQQYSTNIMQCLIFTNVYWDLNIKKLRAAHRGPLNWGAHAMA